MKSLSGLFDSKIWSANQWAGFYMIGASVMILLDDSIGAQWVKIIENLNIHFSEAHEINYYIYKS